jgi:hypothetical protein
MGKNGGFLMKTRHFWPATAVSGQNDSRFGLPPPRRGEKSAFTGQPPWRPGKTAVVWGSRRRVRGKKEVLPGRHRRAGVKRQPKWGGDGMAPLPL